jgi:hypothetical protein
MTPARSFRDGIHHAIRAGELLLAAKGQLPHGNGKNWLKANIRFKLWTARACMRLAELDAEKRQRVADLPMREATKARVGFERGDAIPFALMGTLY